MELAKYAPPTATACQTRPGRAKSSLKESGNYVVAERMTPPLLFQPLQLRSIEFKNRIFVSPMCMYSSRDGFANPFHLAHVMSLVMRGCGLFLMEMTAVQPNGRITPRCHGLWSDDHVAPLADICAMVHSMDARIGIQLAHAGRKASTIPPWMPNGRQYIPAGHLDCGGADGDDGTSSDRLHSISFHGEPGFDIVGPSAIPFDPHSSDCITPRELSMEEIEELIESFGRATRRADQAGFDVVELHAAHGYLLHQFLSPLSNRRTDKYGGSFENRCRVVLEVCRVVRRNWPSSKPVFARFSCTDHIEGGWDMEQTVRLCQMLCAEQLVDFVDCSAGGLARQQQLPAEEEGYQAHFAETIRQQIPGLATGAVGCITDPEAANRLLIDGKADAVLLARAFLRNANWVTQAADRLQCNIDWMPQYARGKERFK